MNYVKIGVKILNFKELQKDIISKTRRNITQSEIAKALKLDKSSISAKLRREAQVKLDELKKVEDYFNISLQNSSYVENINEYAIPILGNLDSSIGYGVTSYNETKNATYGINKN